MVLMGTEREKGFLKMFPILAAFGLGKVKFHTVPMDRKKTGNTCTEMGTTRLTCQTRGDLVSGALLYAPKFPPRILCMSLIIKEKDFHNKVKF